ncbi:GNAT family N-acetyltransferase [Bacillus sp. SM2101]|uniref:GNAT family N-acetyltransferase n=1 Tax=Bacillus sp. SM2101 TaxID=2805366 RepID=UPI001BDF0B63|nr:GNAT family N-acetyltransferase [Bacillus sp. SM2101]
MQQFNTASESTRLVIRPLAQEDYENWLNEFNNRLQSQHRHDEGKIDMSMCTREWFNNLVEKHQELALNDQVYIFGIFLKEAGTHVGMIDFSTLARDHFQWGRIGYTVHNHHWRKGYGKEAVNEGLNIAFRELKFHRIEAHINIDNAPSIQLAKSVGMEFECIRKGFIYEFDEWTDNLVYYKNSHEETGI